MITTAVQSLETAHRAVFDVAGKADVVLAGYEGLSPALSYADIASAIGVDLSTLSRTDAFLFYLAIDAAVEHRGWSVVSEPGELKRFRKLPVTKHYRKPSMSPVAKQRARA